MKYDVVVIGGGVAGVSAAIAASRNGMKVAIVEKMGFFGGLAVGSYVVAMAGIYNGHDGKERCIKGNFDLISKKLIKQKGATPTTYSIPTRGMYREVTIDPESMKYVLDTFMLEYEIDCYLHTVVTDAWIANGKVERIEIWNKGKKVDHIEGRMFIDASGDADMAAYCNIPFNTWATYDKTSGGTMGFRTAGVDVKKALKYRKKHKGMSFIDRKHGIQWSDAGWYDSKNPDGGFFNDNLSVACPGDILSRKGQTYLEMASRNAIQSIIKKLRKQPGYKNVYLVSTGDIFGARKTRHPITLNPLADDNMNTRLYSSIAVAGNVMADYGYMEIPYLTLVPEEINNLFFVGRTIATMHSMKFKGQSLHAYEITRLIPICMATGEAAGVAAALCVHRKTTNAKLPINNIQTGLVSQGAVIHI